MIQDSHLCIYIQRIYKRILKRYLHPHVHYSIIHNSQDMDKDDVVYTYSGILFSYEKERNLPSVTTWMDLDSTVLSEIRQRKTNTI